LWKYILGTSFMLLGMLCKAATAKASATGSFGGGAAAAADSVVTAVMVLSSTVENTQEAGENANAFMVVSFRIVSIRSHSMQARARLQVHE
jgi:hypothetical protein